MSKLIAVLILVLAYGAGSSAGPVAQARDRDRDHLPDRWEHRYDLSTKKPSAKGDPDKDRLTNRREYRHHANPRKRDTDGDGYSDYVEVVAHTNPLDPNRHPGGFPNPSTTGVPAGWAPARTLTSDLHVTQRGAVVQDVLMRGADIVVEAQNVTIRRVDLQGGTVTNQVGGNCGTGLLVEDTTFEPLPGQAFVPGDFPVLGEGGYTARRVEINRVGEGFRASDCGPIRVQDSFALIRGAEPGTSGCEQVHSDGLQGYNGRGVTAINDTLILANRCGTAPFFVPSGQGNTGNYTVDRLLVSGAGFSFRLGVPATVSGLRVVNNSWVYDAIDVRCSAIGRWEAKIVAIDPAYQLTRVVRNQPCNSNGGS